MLAAAEPAMFWPELADALNVLGNRLSALDRQADAVPAAEAVTLYRALAETDPAAYAPTWHGH